MALAFAPIGKKCTVTDIRCDEKTKRHLSNLGILVGSEISAVSDQGGDVIVLIKEARLAMNRALAMKITVA